MQLGAKSLLTGMATRQHTYAMPKRGWKRLAARFRNASSEQSDARERRSRGGLKWTAFRRRPVIGNVELNRSAVVFCGVFLAATVALASRRHSRLRGDGLSWRVASWIAERVACTVRGGLRWKARGFAGGAHRRPLEDAAGRLRQGPEAALGPLVADVVESMARFKG